MLELAELLEAPFAEVVGLIALTGEFTKVMDPLSYGLFMVVVPIIEASCANPCVRGGLAIVLPMGSWMTACEGVAEQVLPVATVPVL